MAVVPARLLFVSTVYRSLYARSDQTVAASPLHRFAVPLPRADARGRKHFERVPFSPIGMRGRTLSNRIVISLGKPYPAVWGALKEGAEAIRSATFGADRLQPSL